MIQEDFHEDSDSSVEMKSYDIHFSINGYFTPEIQLLIIEELSMNDLLTIHSISRHFHHLSDQRYQSQKHQYLCKLCKLCQLPLTEEGNIHMS